MPSTSSGPSTPSTAKADALLAEAASATADEVTELPDFDKAPPTAEPPNINDDPCMRTLSRAERRAEEAKLREMMQAAKEGRDGGTRLESIDVDAAASP